MQMNPSSKLFAAFALSASLISINAADDGFRPLFNGKDLSGWYGDNPHVTTKAIAKKEKREDAIAKQQPEFKAHWSVDNTELVNDGKGPYATTKEEFGDIEFHIDYKTVAKADSGIYLRGTPQVQIWDTTPEGGKVGPPRNADKGSGALFNNTKDKPGQLPLVLADRAFGEWNQFRITQLGSRTTVYYNDKLVVANAIMENYWDKTRKTPLPAKGVIHLQTHGGEIRWRNIKTRDIGSEEANWLLRGNDQALGFKSIFNGKDLNGWAGEKENYEVRDGAIACKAGKGGTLFTEDVYGDFVVRLEFQLPTGGNNGLAIRYPGKGNAAYAAMCELQVLDNTAEKYAKLDKRQYHGSAYGIAPAHRGYLRPIGDWNYQEVTVKGSTIKVELNGTVILDTDVSEPKEYMAKSPHPGIGLKEGHFGFAGHNDPVMFRNIMIKRLD
ncbi:MAG: hypothetical protein ACI9VS_003896 [Candidatus Binatia bacterium]|jgi:hypothetical protein